jgi:CRP-like cAMP-binding protein
MITEIATRRLTLDDALAERETLQLQPAGAILFEEGDQPRGIYVVHSGSIDLLFQARTRELKPVRSAAVGEILGLDSVVSCRPHDYTARVVTACKLGFIDKESFTQMLDASPDLWLTVLRLLSQDIHASYESLRHAGFARP